MAQVGDKVGTLLSENEGWKPLWYTVRNGYLFQYADKNASKPQTGIQLSGQTVGHDSTASKPFAFALTTLTTKIRFAAETEAEMNDWLKVLGGHCTGGTKSTVATSNPVANKVNLEANSAAASAAAAKFAAATIYPEAFWSDSFGKSEEVTWAEFVRVYQDQAKCDLISSNSGSAMYCIANIISQGLLTLKGVLTKTNFLMLTSLFSPFSECHILCRDLVNAEYFHGELTSEGCRSVMGPNPEPGTFLLRLRKGTRNQIALAVAENGTINHTLLDVEKGRWSIRQTNTSFPTLTKLIEGLPQICKKPVPSDIMDKFGPGVQILPLIEQGTFPPPMFNVMTASVAQKTTLEEIVEAKKELQSIQNNFVFSVETPVIELAASKKDTEPEALFLRKYMAKCSESAILNVEIPALQAIRKMKVQMSFTGKEAVKKFLHNAPLENMEKIGLFLPHGGIWIDLTRQLSNYLIAPDSAILVKERPDEKEAKTLLVRNRAAGMDEHIIYDDSTTILGLIQACAKLVPSRVPYSGIRLFPHTHFFAVNSAKLSDYSIGKDITEVEYDDAGQDALYLPPDCVAAVRVKLDQYIELRKNIATVYDKVVAAVCKLTGALPPINTTTAPVLVKKAAAMGTSHLTRPQTRMFGPGDSGNKPAVASGSKPIVVAPSITPSQKVIPEAKAVPEGDVKFSDEDYKKLAEGLPAMELELQDTMKWIANLVYLAVWWDSLDSATQAKPETLQEAQLQVKQLFGPLCTNKANRSTLIDNGVLTAKQIVAVTHCMNFVAEHEKSQ